MISRSTLWSSRLRHRREVPMFRGNILLTSSGQNWAKVGKWQAIHNKGEGNWSRGIGVANQSCEEGIWGRGPNGPKRTIGPKKGIFSIAGRSERNIQLFGRHGSHWTVWAPCSWLLLATPTLCETFIFRFFCMTSHFPNLALMLTPSLNNQLTKFGFFLSWRWR
jgi:hypothetical protein